MKKKLPLCGPFRNDKKQKQNKTHIMCFVLFLFLMVRLAPWPVAGAQLVFAHPGVTRPWKTQPVLQSRKEEF